MATRDEGLDKLEAFIAAAAEARAALQRGGDTLERLGDDVSDLQEDAERRLQEFIDELKEMAERAEPQVERLLPIVVAVVAYVPMFGPLAAAAAELVAVAAHEYGPELRERLQELMAEWPSLSEELGDDLVATIAEETREVEEAFSELMDGVAEEVDAAAEDHDEVLEAFEDPEAVLQNGPEALS
jgi:gas vesicle protein